MPTEQEAVLHNLQAEKTVLGALLLDPQAMLRVSPLLTAEDFYDPVHGAIFAAIDRLHRDRVAIDPVTVADQLAEHTLFHSIGGAAFLAGLVADTPTASHVTSYAEIVREKSNLRALQAVATDIKARGAKGDLPYAEQLASSHEALLALERQRDTHAPQHIATVSNERYDVHAEVREGGDSERKRRLLSGFKNLDYYFGGFTPTSYSIIAGRPGMGKTALMLNMAYNAAQRDEKRVLFFSLEMSKEQLVDRIVSSQLRVALWEMERGNISDDKMLEYGQLADRLANIPLFIDDDPDTSITNLRSKALAHQLEHGLDAVFIDYLQLIDRPQSMRRNANSNEEVTAISKQLKKLARELKVPLLVGSQLSRAVESRNPPIPVLADLRESGSLEQDADAVMLLYRAGYYDEDTANPDLTSVYVRKNRQGPVGTADLVFEKERMTFVPVDHRHTEEPA